MLRAALLRLDRAANRAPAQTALAGLALAVALYAVVTPFLVTRYPPMTDLPFHAAQTSTLRHYWDPSFHFREQFQIQPIAVPYLSMYVIGAVLMLVLPVMTSVKIAAAVMVGLVPAGLAVMFHGMKKSPLLGLLGLGLCWCNLTHWGFLNFVGALGLFAMTIGLTLMLVDRPTPKRQLALGVTLVALFFTHIFRYPFAICAVVGTAIVMYPATRTFRPILAPVAVALVLLVAWYVNRPNLGGDPIVPHLHPERFGELVGDLTGAFTDPNERKAFDSFFRIAFGVGGACLVFQLVRLVVLRRPTTREIAWGAGIVIIPLSCALVFLVLFLVLPIQIGLWWYVYPREATATAFIALGLFPDLPKSTWLRAPLVGALAFGGASVARVVIDNYRRFDASTEDFTAILEKIPRAPHLMYLVFDRDGGQRTSPPFIHFPAYVQAEKGGWLGFHFALWGASPIGYRPRDQAGAAIPPPVPLRWEWTPQIFDVKRNGAFFDTFLVKNHVAPDMFFRADPTIQRVDHIGSWWLYRRVQP